MIIALNKNAPEKEIELLIRDLRQQGFQVTRVPSKHHDVLGLDGETELLDEKRIKAYECVHEVQRITAPYKLANRQYHPEDSVIDVAGIKIGGNEPVVLIGGPCSVENRDQIFTIAEQVKHAGAVMLRGGAYKPRTSPYAFQGLRSEGIHELAEAGRHTQLPIVSELMSAEHLEEFEKHVDLIQIGARNMQNFELLKALGKTKKPILLKRGMANTIEEWIMSAEYIIASGNPNVIFCERGIRTFEKYTRNTLDLTSIPILKEKTHLPVVVDPSHSTGDYRYVESMSMAAIAAGADGLIIEVHHNPECALSDGSQSLKPEKFEKLVNKCRIIADALERGIR
ncbi:MAG: 3-deoxy-7-phosphoheptulonate synthase [Erysipelotrichaceae bacterium]|nr:3-deoxy-7-phosphoheptulonate synthase [Erysipelotrichaceae bacterium]